jgi:MarR family transcriptional regulator, transcriptional regulator for hemolysin
MTCVEVLEKFGSVRRALNRLAVQRLKAVGLGTKQALVLRVVNNKGECSITELAQTSESDLAAVSRMITSLVKSGWLTRSVHPGDGRQSVIKLSPKAKRRMEEIDMIVNDLAELFAAPVTPDELDILYKVLEKMDIAFQDTSK